MSFVRLPATRCDRLRPVKTRRRVQIRAHSVHERIKVTDAGISGDRFRPVRCCPAFGPPPGSAHFDSTPFDLHIDAVERSLYTQPTHSFFSRAVPDQNAINDWPPIPPIGPREYPTPLGPQNHEAILHRPFRHAHLVRDALSQPVDEPPSKRNNHQQLNRKKDRQTHICAERFRGLPCRTASGDWRTGAIPALAAVVCSAGPSTTTESKWNFMTLEAAKRPAVSD